MKVAFFFKVASFVAVAVLYIFAFAFVICFWILVVFIYNKRSKVVSLAFSGWLKGTNTFLLYCSYAYGSFAKGCREDLCDFYKLYMTEHCGCLFVKLNNRKTKKSNT